MTDAPLRLGVSSYSYAASLSSGRLDLPGLIDLVAESDAAHLEVAGAGLGVDLADEPATVRDLAARAQDRGLPIENYVVGADFRTTGAALAEQVDRVREQIDVAAALGSPRMRHDVTAWAWRDADQAEFEAVFAAIVPVCRELADYGAERGVVTTVENHGFFMNNSERLRRLVHAVDHPNFGALLDVGNFLCVDEDPVSAVRLTLPMARVVHLKDFRIRSTASSFGDPGPGWLRTLAGSHILGTVVGLGDVPIRRLLRQIADSGFDGPVSIEFEGVEDDQWAVQRGLAETRRLWSELDAEEAWSGVPATAPAAEVNV